MTAHSACPTCRCDPLNDRPSPPATSSRWAIDQAKQAADEAVKRAKEKRIAEAKAAKEESK